MQRFTHLPYFYRFFTPKIQLSIGSVAAVVTHKNILGDTFGMQMSAASKAIFRSIFGMSPIQNFVTLFLLSPRIWYHHKF